MTLRGPVPPGGGPRPTIATVGPNEVATPFVADPTTPAARQTTVTITTRTQDPRNSNGLIEMDFSSPARVPLFAGEYEIHLENAFNSLVVVDGYTDKSTPGLVFTSNVDRDNTITTPGNGKLVVTVGAYAPRRGVLFFKWNGDLTGFSSFGPTRDVRNKPDIAAPGAKITSVKSGEAGLKHCCCDCCFWFYTDETKEGGEFSGTSMAAPHATGVIALMLEKAATLTALDIVKILGDTASEPEVDHGSLPDEKWGAGRLNALGAVDGVPGPTPIAGPSPLLGPTTPGTPSTPAPVFGPTALLRPSDDGSAARRLAAADSGRAALVRPGQPALLRGARADQQQQAGRPPLAPDGRTATAAAARSGPGGRRSADHRRRSGVTARLAAPGGPLPRRSRGVRFARAGRRHPLPPGPAAVDGPRRPRRDDRWPPAPATPPDMAGPDSLDALARQIGLALEPVGGGTRGRGLVHLRRKPRGAGCRTRSPPRPPL